MLRRCVGRCVPAAAPAGGSALAAMRVAPHRHQARWRSEALPSQHKEHNLFTTSLLAGGILATMGVWILKAELYGGDNAMAPFDVLELRSKLDELFKDHPEFAPMALKLIWNANGAFDCKRPAGDRNGSTGNVDVSSKPFSNMGDFMKALEELKADAPISNNDLWALTAFVGVQAMGGPEIPFKYGRVDKEGLPEGLEETLKTDVRDANELRRYFYKHGLNDQELVVLMGAHGLGRCHPKVSGVEGSWCKIGGKKGGLFGKDTPAPALATRFNNGYFKNLLNTEWVQSECGHYYYNKHDRSQISLPVDQLLVSDDMFRYWCKTYAEDDLLFADQFAAAFKRVSERAHAPWGPVPY